MHVAPSSPASPADRAARTQHERIPESASVVRMLQHSLLGLSPRALRWYRNRLNLDFPTLLSFLPTSGGLLDVGCGVGSVDFELGRRLPGVSVTGLDLDATSIQMARRYHVRPNVSFQLGDIFSVDGSFDCILLCDVLHHVELASHNDLLTRAGSLLAPDGFLLIKEIQRDGGQVGWWMDRYISRCPAVAPLNCDELVSNARTCFDQVASRTRFRTPFPHCYVTASAPRTR